jgi:hypothetical protein
MFTVTAVISTDPKFRTSATLVEESVAKKPDDL